MNTTGYIGVWASYEYADVLNIKEDGTYQYSALGNLDGGIVGTYKVYDDLSDIPDEIYRQIKRSYSAGNAKWIVLFDVVGNVFDFGYYDMKADEFYMPDLFIRR